MNNDQLKHIVTVLHAMAVGLFAVFGYRLSRWNDYRLVFLHWVF
jgi:hypothetical protein